MNANPLSDSVASICAAITACRSAPSDLPSAVEVENVIEQRAGGGLAGLVQPVARQHRVVIRTPYSGNLPGIGRGRHVARRCAGDHRNGLVEAAGVEPAEHADSAGMGIDRADADHAVAGQAKFVGAFGSQRAGICTDRQRRGGQRRPVLQVIEPDAGTGNRFANPAARGRDRSICMSPCRWRPPRGRSPSRSGSR